LNSHTHTFLKNWNSIQYTTTAGILPNNSKPQWAHSARVLVIRPGSHDCDRNSGPRLLGNTVPALHAHIQPRFADEPPELRSQPLWDLAQVGIDPIR
jgi:hypothetical protein